MLGVALPLLACGGGDEDRLKVTGTETDSAYGRGELLAAVARYSQGERSPARYRVLAQEVAALKPKFNEIIAAEAERNLIILALGPLESLYGEPMDKQFQALALTVWPTALEVEPKPDDTPGTYAERLCREPLAVDCKHVVPEHRPTILSAMVWDELEGRARDTVIECPSCAQDPGYAEAIARYAQRADEMATRAAQIEEEAHPQHWPVAGPNAGPWPDVPLVVVRDDGTTTLAGRDLPAGERRKALAASREDTAILGVYIGPSATVAWLRALAEDAAASGFRELAIQARTAEYPYSLRAYRLPATRRGRGRVGVRDTDSVQILVQTLEAAAAQGAPQLSM